MSSLHPPVEVASRGRRVLFAVLGAGALGLLLFLATRPRSHPTAPMAEVHRTNLHLRAAGWFVPGDTNGFTGMLLDTYDDGALKSRSAISNGLLQGLSQGWHTNGQPQVEEQFVAGLSHGLRTKWHANGRKLSVINIVQGQLQGVFRSWHENGEPAEEFELKDGHPDGVARAYFPSGFLKSRVRLQHGRVVEQQFWKDGEHREPAPIGPIELSRN